MEDREDSNEKRNEAPESYPNREIALHHAKENASKYTGTYPIDETALRMYQKARGC